MKNTKKTWMATLALASILSLSIPAFAETATETTENPAAVEETTTPAEDTATTEEAQSSDTALMEAYAAYAEARYNAKVQKRQEALKTELDGYVEAGNMTREQADLILNAEAERSAARKEARNGKNGSCTGMPKSMNGQPGKMPGNGGRNGRNNRMNPGMGNSKSVPQNGNNGMMPQNGNGNTGRGPWAVPQNGTQGQNTVPNMGGRFHR